MRKPPVRRDPATQVRVARQFRLVTPCFAGGGSRLTEEIRLPAILGMIRMWWRATEARPLLAAGGPMALLQREGELFGSAAGETSGGQGMFLPTLVILGAPPPVKLNNKLSRALATYVGQGGANKRRFLAVEDAGPFSLTFAFKTTAPDIGRKQILDAFDRWLLLGGLGSRLPPQPRRESFAPADATAYRDESALGDRLAMLLPAISSAKGPLGFPACSSVSWVRCKHFPGATPQDALAEHAQALDKFARDYQEDGKPVRVPDDAPARFIRGQKKAGERLGSDDVFSDQIFQGQRRPSPLHVHAAAAVANGALIVCTYLPTADGGPHSKVGQRITRFFEANPDYRPIWP